MDTQTCLDLAHRYYNVSSPAFVEYLCTLGVVTYDGVPKEGFTALLNAL